MSQYVWNGQQVLDEVHVRIKAEMIDMGQRVVTLAKSMAPVRTGELRDSIYYAWNDATYTVAFMVDAKHGVFVEYGTRHMRPHPYLRPAIYYEGAEFGIDMAMVFQNTPFISQPIIARGGGFHLPPTLTAKQRQHVATYLKPESERFNAIGASSRARLYVRRRHF